MATYRSLQVQISKLQDQAEALRAKEVQDVIGRIREAIEVYGLTAADLGFSGSPRKGKTSSPTKARGAGQPPLYRDPKSGKTWSGRGRVPHWIAKARDRTRFLIESQESPGSDTASKADKEAAPSGRLPRAATPKRDASETKKSARMSSKSAKERPAKTGRQDAKPASEAPLDPRELAGSVTQAGSAAMATNQDRAEAA